MANTFQSEFKAGVTVSVVNKDDFEYAIFQPLFEEYGYGFVAPNEKIIIIDGQYNSTYQKIVEAHEVAHIILKHNENENHSDEIEADIMAHQLLSLFGYDKEAKFLLRKFKGRHGVPMAHKSMDIHKQKVKTYLNKNKSTKNKK